MANKLKVFSISCSAALLMGATMVVDAPATSTGHFYSHSVSGSISLIGSENPTHFTEFTSHGLEGGTICNEVSYQGTIGTTATYIDLAPTYKKCHTTLAPESSTIVHVNGCSYTFTPGDVGTLHLDCQAGKSAEFTHPNCTLRVTPQTISGVAYTEKEESGLRFITVDMNTAQFNTEYEAGICIFTGTNHTATLHGSFTLKGFEGASQRDITHTAT